MYVVNFRQWLAADVPGEAAWWFERNALAPRPLWRLGTQPIMHLLFAHDTFLLDPSFNCQAR